MKRRRESFSPPFRFSPQQPCPDLAPLPEFASFRHFTQFRDLAQFREYPPFRDFPPFPDFAPFHLHAFSMTAALACVFAFSADRLTKSLVTQHLMSAVVSLGPVGHIRRVVSRRHHGSSNQTILVATWCAALLCAIVLRARLGWFEGQIAAVGLGAAFGGAAGNLFDVLRGRPIIDFIDLRFWPAFNVADVAIVVGLVMAFLP